MHMLILVYKLLHLAARRKTQMVLYDKAGTVLYENFIFLKCIRDVSLRGVRVLVASTHR